MKPVSVAGTPSVHLLLRVTPRAAKNAVDGWRADAVGDPRLLVRVTAPADKGRANKAVIRLIAKSMGVAPGRIRIIRGETDRNKVLAFDGETSDIRDRINTAFGNTDQTS